MKAAYVTGSTLRVAAWVLVPVVAVLGFDLYIEHEGKAVWEEIKMTLPEKPDLSIKVNGKQFVWEITHPGVDEKLGTADDIESFGDLHVPLNAVVRFDLTATDVIHSFFIPNFRLKQDAVPGRTIPGWFQATREGEYQIVCAELCGIGHTTMKGTITVDGPERYRAWLREASGLEAEPPATEEKDTDQGKDAGAGAATETTK